MLYFKKVVPQSLEWTLGASVPLPTWKQMGALDQWLPEDTDSERDARIWSEWNNYMRKKLLWRKTFLQNVKIRAILYEGAAGSEKAVASLPIDNKLYYRMLRYNTKLDNNVSFEDGEYQQAGGYIKLDNSTFRKRIIMSDKGSDKFFTCSATIMQSKFKDDFRLFQREVDIGQNPVTAGGASLIASKYDLQDLDQNTFANIPSEDRMWATVEPPYSSSSYGVETSVRISLTYDIEHMSKFQVSEYRGISYG